LPNLPKNYESLMPAACDDLKYGQSRLINRMVDLVIDLPALRHNFRQLREVCGPEVKIMAVIKADAYGHGLLPSARSLKAEEVDYFGVAYLAEGLCLRQAGIDTPILLLMGIMPEEADAAVAADLEVALFSRDIAASLAARARQQNKKARVHVKIDTGMGRLGLLPREVRHFLEYLAGLPELEVVGIISHFAESDISDQSFTLKQLQDFDELLQQVLAWGWSAPVSHIANSAAILHVHRSHLNMVRAGISLYGSPPSQEIPVRVKLKPVMSLRTRVLQLKNLPAGASISYGRTYITPAPIRLAVLPIGYCNGYSRLFSNRGWVLINGRRAPIRGRVCMNLTMVEVTDIPEIKEGNTVTLLGQDGSDSLSADNLADWANTISYEIYCLLGNSNYRRYIGEI
jgi:alanine racemase